MTFQADLHQVMVSTGCVSICLMMHDKFYSQHMRNIDQWIYTLCYMYLFQGQNEYN